MGGIWSFVARFISVYSWVLLVYVMLGWVAPGAGAGLRDVYRALGSICEPFLSLFRRVLPPIAVGGAGLDLSPMLAVLVLQILARTIGGL